jgi:hypothetical protein
MGIYEVSKDIGEIMAKENNETVQTKVEGILTVLKSKVDKVDKSAAGSISEELLELQTIVSDLEGQRLAEVEAHATASAKKDEDIAKLSEKNEELLTTNNRLFTKFGSLLNENNIGGQGANSGPSNNRQGSQPLTSGQLREYHMNATEDPLGSFMDAVKTMGKI